MVDLSFNSAYIDNSVPTEQRQSIENMRTAFHEIDDLVSNVNADTEELSLDDIRVKAIFYALFYEKKNLSSIDTEKFISCFYRQETRIETKTDVDEFGELYTYEEEITINIPHSDLLLIYGKIDSEMNIKATDEEISNANEIYYRQKYGESPNDVMIEDVEYINIDGFVEPVDNWQSSVTSEYGMRFHPIYGTYGKHGGIDLAKSKGTPIYSVLDGTVTVATYHNSYGNYVKIEHDDGLETLYAHCSKILVKIGDQVNAGDEIAKVGTTGTSTGNHLHFETILYGEKVNPRAYLPRK